MNKKLFYFLFLFLVIFILCLLPREHSFTLTDLFDTVSNITFSSNKDYTEKYKQLLTDTDKKLSAYNPESEIYTLNHNGEALLSDDVFRLLTKSVDYSKKLGNYFDITVNPLCILWQDAEQDGIPKSVDKELSSVGIDSILLDYDSKTAKLKNGASITLGAIAKGYVTDRLVSEMRKDKVKSALINLGGNVYALGKKGSTPWKIGIANPKDSNACILTLKICDKAVVTSGDYQRAFEKDGILYHHIIDPKTGYPAKNGLHSVTVIGDSAEICDVLSTAMFVAGAEIAQQLAKEYDVDIILIDDDTCWYSEGVCDMIDSRNEEYNFVELKGAVAK